jgi:hypothetical protein
VWNLIFFIFIIRVTHLHSFFFIILRWIKEMFYKRITWRNNWSVSTQSSSEEMFQNEVLRPILKLQNDLFIASFKNYSAKYIKILILKLQRKVSNHRKCDSKDSKYRNTLKGMVLGLFTIEEYSFYIKNSSNLNKRMMTMLIERLKAKFNCLNSVLFNGSTQNIDFI